MASSNIKLFDENKGNMLTDTEFNISSQRLNGLQTGVASSQLQNKAMYQASLVAYAIAQIMLQNGLNANDTDAVSAFVANLSGAILQKVYDVATTAEAQAGTATGKWMSPALVKAAIDYIFGNSKATTAEAQAGTDDTKWMSPAKVISLLTAQGCTEDNIIKYAALAMSGDSGFKATVTPTASGSIGTDDNSSSKTSTITFDLSSLPSDAKICFMNASEATTGSVGQSGSPKLNYTATLKFGEIIIDTKTGTASSSADLIRVVNSMLVARNIVAAKGNYMTNFEKIVLTFKCSKASGSGYFNTKAHFGTGTVINYLK